MGQLCLCRIPEQRLRQVHKLDREDIWIALDKSKIEKSLLYLEVNKIVGEQEEGTSKFRATLGLL